MARLTTLTPLFVRTVPAKLEEGTLYVSTEFEVAIHLCACGCGEKTITPFGSSLGWQITHKNGLVTLNPSIANYQVPCRSHYWISDNEVRWG